jgi:hypothetical protein
MMVQSDNDIASDYIRRRTWTTTGKWALLTLILSVILTIVAFSTPNWIESDPRFYGSKMERVGLWVHCFRSLPDFSDPEHRKFFAGCRWIFDPFTEGYQDIRYYISPRKFFKFLIPYVLENFPLIFDHFSEGYQDIIFFSS